MAKKSTANQSPVVQELKSAAVRSITAITVIIGGAAVFIVVLMAVTLYGLLSLSPNCNPDDKKLQNTNAVQKKNLDGITILSGQHANSEAHRDCPSGDVYAEAELPTSMTASKALTDVRRNVESQGFKREGLVSVSQGAIRDDNAFVVNDLHEKYFRSDRSEELQIEYTFTKDYPCDDIKQLCGYSDFEPVDLLLQSPLKSVTAYYYIRSN